MRRNITYTKTASIPEHVYQIAQERAKNQRVFSKSHRKEEANDVGCLGEVIAEFWMQQHDIKFTPELENTTHDYRINGNITIDVKTKDRTVKPRLDYDNSAPCYNHLHQKPDYFLFISLERNRNDKRNNIRKYHTAYIVGSISYEELDRIGIKFLAGEIDWRNNTKFWTNCLNIEMWQLVPLVDTIKIFQGKLSAPTQSGKVNQEIVNEIKIRINSGEYQERPLPS
jgi:hypothetical protein